ncbi:hypothetical protein FDP41_006121 [Naegleria fowleri]|uniref:Actin n=1 Tax=Naegleria fowleri TaxID=5763 RepID=A0A6A5BC28_NAEFO|nr:uncharacterized protein FDP41_006121 [Naegleria fowleri]KAF0974647.1 hypothetical protein FDP41_006121 [Naegleria fowleri]CAG4711315.1 unnamed protein product [Naegleria fowleri]
MTDPLACVVDLGSYNLQCGLDNREFIPRSVFRNVLLEIEKSSFLIGDDQVGEYVKKKHHHTPPMLNRSDDYNDDDELLLHYPVQHGQIQNWFYFEQVLHFMYDSELRISSEDHPCFMTHCPLFSMHSKKQLLHLLFENFQVPKFYGATQSKCSLLRHVTSGLEVSSGHDMTYVVPIVEGMVLPHAVVKSGGAGGAGGENGDGLGGRYVNEQLEWLLKNDEQDHDEMEIRRRIQQQSSSLKNNASLFMKHQALDEIKRRGGFFISQDYEADFMKMVESKFTSTNVTHYQLPDGKEIVLDDKVRIQSTEILFQPHLRFLSNVLTTTATTTNTTTSTTLGLHEMIYQCVQQCPVDLRSTLWSNIVLSGGNTLFRGIETRLRNELNHLVPTNVNIGIIAPPERQYSVWMGALALAKSSQLDDLWVTCEEFHEFGENIAHRKLIMT